MQRLKEMPMIDNTDLEEISGQICSESRITIPENTLVKSIKRFCRFTLKFFFDMSITLLLFILVFSWLFPIIAILIKFDSRGPIFYIQERWGRYGLSFRCIKFRTMKHGASTVGDNGQFKQTSKYDSRVTKLGAFLRKTNLDETPQFLNVLLGEMSIIGPRPHAIQHSIESQKVIENYNLRLSIKPGITGWAQVNGYRGETHNILQMKKRVEFDIWYINNWSLFLDCKIFFKTIYYMLKGDKMAY